MNDLLKLAIEGHGGARRWEQISRFRASASITGAIWSRKGKPGLLRQRAAGGRDPRPAGDVTPFRGPASTPPGRRTGRRARPPRVCWVAGRLDPAASFARLTRQSPWDDLQVAYFAGEASWNYFVATFILARPDFVDAETEPWHEDGQVRRRLVVTTRT